MPVVSTAWVVALFPPALFWSAFLFRESITWLLMAVFLYAVAGIARRITARDLAIMVVALAALMWFRGTAAIILAGVSMIVLVATASRRTLLPRLGIAGRPCWCSRPDSPPSSPATPRWTTSRRNAPT